MPETNTYSERRKEEFSLMVTRVREALNWDEYTLGAFIRSSQFVVSNLQTKSDRLRRTPVLKRRVSRLTCLYNAVTSGVLRGNASLRTARRRVVLPAYLSQYIKGERDEDIPVTLAEAKRQGSRRAEAPSVQGTPVAPAPVTPEEPAPASSARPGPRKRHQVPPEQLSLGFPDPTPPQPPEKPKEKFDPDKAGMRELLVSVYTLLGCILAIVGRTEVNTVTMCTDLGLAAKRRKSPAPAT